MARHDSVEDGIGNGGTADLGMPMFNRQFTGNDRGLVGGTVVNDLQQV